MVLSYGLGWRITMIRGISVALCAMTVMPEGISTVAVET
jgi:hypothetical protein